MENLRKRVDIELVHHEKKTFKAFGIHHENHKNCLFNREFQKDSMATFRSFNHKIYTIVLNKTSLSSFDDKIHILDDGIHTLALGHFKTRDAYES